MPKITDITVLNIDEKPYAVDALSDEVKELVDMYNEWTRKEADVRDELNRFAAAKDTLSRQIIAQTREFIEKKEGEEEAAAAAADDHVHAEPEVLPEAEVASDTEAMSEPEVLPEAEVVSDA